MSVVRQLVQIAVVEALRGRTAALGNVFDSNACARMAAWPRRHCFQGVVMSGWRPFGNVILVMF